MSVNIEKWDAVFKKKEEIVSRKIAGETILVPVRGKLADMQSIFTLNPVGDFIWGSLDGKKTLRQIGNEIVEAFEVGNEQSNADVLEFIQELIKAGLVSEVK